MSKSKTDLFSPQTISRLDQLQTKIYADGADLKEMLHWASHPYISGLTTNPSLMRVANITNYENFCRTVLQHITDLPISFEVFSDDLDEMEEQARYIATWGNNIHIKIPVMNTQGEFTGRIIQRLSKDKIPLNVTAILTLAQTQAVIDALHANCPAIISIFAGRIADTGVDPVPLMAEAVKRAANKPNIEILWASSRELLNIFHADSAGCQIITVPHAILKKLNLVQYDLDTYTLDTVKMFYQDAVQTGYQLNTKVVPA